MSAFISNIAAVFITIPIIGYILIFMTVKQITKNHRKSVHLALDGSTILFIISVHYLVLTIWEKSYLWLILLLMILIAVIVVLIHWKVKQEIDFRRILRGFWRANFLVFFILYLILFVTGLVKGILDSLL